MYLNRNALCVGYFFKYLQNLFIYFLVKKYFYWLIKEKNFEISCKFFFNFHGNNVLKRIVIKCIHSKKFLKLFLDYKGNKLRNDVSIVFYLIGIWIARIFSKNRKTNYILLNTISVHISNHFDSYFEYFEYALT